MSGEELKDIWVYLSTSPLLGLTLTLVAYQAGHYVYTRLGLFPLANPVLIAVILLVALLWMTGTPYPIYFDGAKFVHFLLGPATVALAIPLYIHFQAVKRSVVAILATVIVGSTTAMLSAIGVAWAMGATRETLLSIAPKSVTMPIAMGISEKLGGLPSLTAVLVLLTGIAGAMLATWTLNLLRIKDWRARGLATGIAAHGIGTARALQVNEVAGAFASLGMGLNALATAILLPLLASLFL
ncbi:MAG: LrgB family protein [Alphaproteobacteria bacterium]|nr:LrgB family protein [Alphaproteobacteria bacterium]MBU0798949.1 LrgB family protein [Alphaproteobacteria bacterium]MBU0887703.1 LrgB family protein [Alphaproteobacteria bacterium]MBU1812658.1 LrgB family protein [Alphaproteobacteria bacterium]MBU2090861.1 LrgB family protein [Alphaproteobacteria bacterium]